MKQMYTSFMFQHRGLIGIAVFAPILGMVLFSKPFFYEGTLLDTVMDGCGWLFFIFYVMLRLWATMYIGRRKDHELQIMGPYSLCRNPLYLGSFCFGLSLALFFQSILLFAATFIMAGIYFFWIIPEEEKVLQKIFEVKFSAYCRKISRLMPSFRQYKELSSVTVNIKGIKLECKRLLLASVLPFVAELIMCFRSAAWWPQIFLFT